MVTIAQALQTAVQHHQSGELDRAGPIYEQILQVNPNHPDALQLVGVMSRQLGRPHEAIRFIKRAINVQPEIAEYHSNLAAAWMDVPDAVEAAECCRRAISLQPRYAEAHRTLGNALQAMGQLAEAEYECRRAVLLAPDHANGYFNLANVQRDRDELDCAVDSYTEAISLDPSHYRAMNNLGQVLARLDRLEDAGEILQRAVKIAPEQPAILKNLASVEARHGQAEAALEHYRQALRLVPDDAGIMNSLGFLLHGLRRWDEAADILEQAIRLSPNLSAAHNNLGMVRAARRQRRAAIASYEAALQSDPDSIEALCNLASVLRDLGRNQQARNCLQRALRLDADCVEALNIMGTVAQASGDIDEALNCYRRAVELWPDFPDGLCNLASVHALRREHDRARQLYQQSLDLAPDSVDTLNNFSNLLRAQGELATAAELMRRAIALSPNDSELYSNLASVMKDSGQIDLAMTAYDRAVELEPDWAALLSNRLSCHQYFPEITLKTLADEHARFDDAVARPLRVTWQPFANDRDPERPLRVGFVSSDFASHPVGFLLVRGFESFNSEQLTAVCYSNRPHRDALTDRIGVTASLWREVSAWSDDQLTQQIRADRIDILVDLAGHTAGNRMLVFARKPAPVQVTWLGYAGTTGLTAMDYLLTDRFHVPPAAEPHYVENIVRLPGPHFVFEPPADSPDVGPLPLLTSGTATFASFNNPAKISSRVIRLWAQILKRTTGARLRLKYRGFDDPLNVTRCGEQLRAEGIDAARLELQGWSPPREMLEEYNRVDVALDPFPFNGGMTTLLSLWMGVPVITVADETYASRQSMSFLTQLGLTELIAADMSDYVERACTVAADVDHLQELRSTLRQRLLDSPLCDSNSFARSVESACRDMWRKWCQSMT